MHQKYTHTHTHIYCLFSFSIAWVFLIREPYPSIHHPWTEPLLEESWSRLLTHVSTGEKSIDPPEFGSRPVKTPGNVLFPWCFLVDF